MGVSSDSPNAHQCNPPGHTRMRGRVRLVLCGDCVRPRARVCNPKLLQSWYSVRKPENVERDPNFLNDKGHGSCDQRCFLDTAFLPLFTPCEFWLLASCLAQ